MIKRTKTMASLISGIACVGFFAPAAQAQIQAQNQGVTHTLHTYAGPQSVTPEQVINVTIEMMDFQGNSLNNQPVQLTYIADGISTKLKGVVINGLVSFDVNAQSKAGMMNFIAGAKGVVSNIAPVMVVAGQPMPFNLTVKRARNHNFIAITSGEITDLFENAVSDQTFVTLEWVDNYGVRSSENLQLSNGRIDYTSRCPVKFTPPLNIRAVLKNRDVLSSDITRLCPHRKVGV